MSIETAANRKSAWKGYEYYCEDREACVSFV